MPGLPSNAGQISTSSQTGRMLRTDKAITTCRYPACIAHHRLRTALSYATQRTPTSSVPPHDRATPCVHTLPATRMHRPCPPRTPRAAAATHHKWPPRPHLPLLPDDATTAPPSCRSRTSAGTPRPRTAPTPTPFRHALPRHTARTERRRATPRAPDAVVFCSRRDDEPYPLHTHFVPR